MIALDDFQDLKRRVDDLTRRCSEASGALKEKLKTLEREFGCKTLKEAKILLKQMKEQELVAYDRYTKAKKRFETRWGDFLTK